MNIKKYDIMILSGGFDPVHKGHVRMFKAAKNMAVKVIVGVNSDKWLINKKGKSFMNFAERAEIIKAFRYVDEVVMFNDDDGTAIDLLVRIQRLYPECNIAFGNGGDRTVTNTPEKGFCDAYNIDMVWQVGGGKVQSSSELIEKSEKEEIKIDNTDYKELLELKLQKIDAIKSQDFEKTIQLFQDFEKAVSLRMKERDILEKYNLKDIPN